VFLGLMIATVLLGTSSQLVANDDDPYGFTVGQLHSAMLRGGLTGQRLNSVHTFGAGDGGFVPAYVGILSSSRSGWHISVFRRVAGGFRREWYSQKLPSEFAVSSPENFSIEDVGDESVVVFSGCAPHMCGRAIGLNGVLLYSTERKEVFFARYEPQAGNPSGSVQFSKNVSEARNQRYREALQKALDAITK